MWEIFLNIFLKLLSWVRGRPFISIRIIEDEPDKGIGHLRFEVENQSKAPVSLGPHIKATCWHPVNGIYVKASTVYDIRELDRTLPPFTPKILSATARNLPRWFGYSWFRTYKFYPTKGPGTTVRIRNALLERMNSFQYAIEIIKFRTKGQVKTYK